jgi:hypothetical protein
VSAEEEVKATGLISVDTLYQVKEEKDRELWLLFLTAS